jgi:hypothetical protein
MNENLLKYFNFLLNIRARFKRVSQISWNINQLEKRYPVETIRDDEIPILIEAYKSQLELLAPAVKEINHLLKNG